MIVVPQAFVRDTIRREGDEGRAWLAALPAVVAELCARWDLDPDAAVMHGYVGIVVPVRRGGEGLVLKVSYPDDDSRDEAAALAAWQGDGAVRLIDHDADRWALLLERLEATRTLGAEPAAEAIAVAAGLVRRLAIPASAGFATQRSKLDEIASHLPERWETYGRPFPRRVLDRCMEAATRLPVRQSLLVDWDLHYDNVLAGTREPWLAIDPKVVVGDPEFGIAQLFYNQAAGAADLAMESQFAIAVEAAGLDPQLAREWTLVRCIDVGLWCLTVGLTEMPRVCLDIAQWIDGHDW